MAINDVVISSRIKDVDYKSLPIVENIQNKPRNGFFVDHLRQKSYIIGDTTLILWSGNMDLAHRVMSRIIEFSDDGKNIVEIVSLIDSFGFSKSEASSFSIIYHFAENDGIKRAFYNCQENALWDIAFSGSGKEHFLNSLTQETPLRHVDGTSTEDDKKNLILFFLYRLFLASLSEMSNLSTVENNYGGWLEICLFENGKFIKVPYCIKFWRKIDNNTLDNSAPLHYSTYKDGVLAINSVTYQRDNGEEIYDIRCTTVPGICLEKEEIAFSKIDPIEITWNPQIQIHCVAQPGLWNIIFKVGYFSDFSLNFGVEDVSFSIGESFIEELLKPLTNSNEVSK